MKRIVSIATLWLTGTLLLLQIDSRHALVLRGRRLVMEREPSEIWRSRRKIAGVVLKPVAVAQAKARLNKDTRNPKVDEESSKKSSISSGAIAATFVIAAGAVAIRLGGRTAFMQVLGLDFAADPNLKEQITSFIDQFHSYESVGVLYFFGAWFVAKLLCIDLLTIVLAFSSGVLFNGLFSGTAISVACSSLASLLIFTITRSLLQERAREGLKTVFTLRVSPLLPIPIGAYNYIYGATSVKAFDFIAGITLGSIKPYLLDSYLGLFGKSLIDEPTSATGALRGKDAVLLGVLALVILVGSFATQLAASTWQEIQDEIKVFSNEKRTKEDSDVTFMEMFGLEDKDLPPWLREIKNDLEFASTRIGNAIMDEWQRVEQTEGKLNTTTKELPRNIQDYEVDPPSGKNVKQYTIESLIFPYVLLSNVLKLSAPNK